LVKLGVGAAGAESFAESFAKLKLKFYLTDRISALSLLIFSVSRKVHQRRTRRTRKLERSRRRKTTGPDPRGRQELHKGFCLVLVVWRNYVGRMAEILRGMYAWMG